MDKYATAQRKLLYAFLKSYPDRQFSIDEIAAQLCSTENISLSSIYRNVNKLVDQGYIRRFVKDGSRKFRYQYVGDADCNAHLHFKCVKCGKIIHMDHDTMEEILGSAMKNNDFRIDIGKTILYGSCRSCIFGGLLDR